MNLCVACCNKFIKRGGDLRILKKENKEYFCDNCLTKTFVVFYTNPFICQWCSKKLGRTHKYGLKDMKREQAKVEEYKRRRGIKQ